MKLEEFEPLHPVGSWINEKGCSMLREVLDSMGLEHKLGASLEIFLLEHPKLC